MKLLIGIVALLLLAQPSWGQTFTLLTTGASTITPLISNFIFSFRSVNPTTAIQFLGTPSTTNKQTRLATLGGDPTMADLDFGMSNNPYTTEDQAYATSKGIGSLVSIPFTAAPTVISYNLPATASYGGVALPVMAAGSTLTLDRTAIFKIFSNTVTSWGDSDILNYNKGSASVNYKSGVTATLGGNTSGVINGGVLNTGYTRSINIIYRADPSGSTNTFLSALSSFGSTAGLTVPSWMTSTDLPSWPYPNSMSRCPPANMISAGSPWTLSVASSASTNSNCSVPPPGSSVDPATLTPQVCNVAGGYACSVGINGTLNGDVLTSVITSVHAYSVSYFPLPMLYPAQVTANIVNRAGTTITPSMVTAGVQAAILASVSAPTTSPFGDLSGVVDNTDPLAYPFVEMTWYTMPQIVSTDCARALQVALFLIWSIQSSTANSAMTFLGYVPLPQSMQKTAIDTITELRCGSVSNNQAVFDALQSDESALQIISFIAGGLLVLLSGVLIWKKDHPSIRQLSFPVMMFLCIGAAGNIFTVSLYVGHPTQATCSVIPWAKVLELVTVFSVFIVRVKRWLRIKDEDDELQLSDAIEHTVEPTAENGVEMTNRRASITKAVSSSHVSDQLSDTTKNVYWFGICASVILLWLIIPITWISMEPPVMRQRTCVGSLRSTFILADLFFNVLLILLTSVFAYMTNELDHVVHPIFIMLLDVALFQPMSFILEGQQFPNRTPVALALQPSVGILLGTLLETGLILGPNLLDALRFTPEEVLAQIALQKDVNTFRRQSTDRLNKRFSSKGSVEVEKNVVKVDSSP
jgi:ABC-type phosphate transport system substrate-binding protein